MKLKRVRDQTIGGWLGGERTASTFNFSFNWVDVAFSHNTHVKVTHFHFLMSHCK